MAVTTINSQEEWLAILGTAANDGKAVRYHINAVSIAPSKCIDRRFYIVFWIRRW